MNKEEIKILVVDDKKQQRDDLKWSASIETKKGNRQIYEASDTDAAIKLINKNNFYVVVTDVWLDDVRQGGLDILKAAKKKDPLTQVIVVTAFGKTERGPQIGVTAMLNGAFDYIESNIPGIEYLELLKHKINLALEFRFAKIEERKG